jgi:predicted dehydrogenase
MLQQLLPFEGAAPMATRNIGVVIDGATGRLGATQHLRSLMAVRSEGGLVLANGDCLVPEPVLLGRNPEKLAALAAANGDPKWSTDRDTCLGDPNFAIYFDANATGGRPARAGAALAAGKHVYLEKPIAETLEEALDLARRAERASVKNGVVQDKLFLPGLRKLRKLYDADFFGGFCRSGSTSAGGCSTARLTRHSGPAGIIAKRLAAGLYSICSPIGATSSIASWARSKPFRVVT